MIMKNSEVMCNDVCEIEVPNCTLEQAMEILYEKSRTSLNQHIVYIAKFCDNIIRSDMSINDAFLSLYNVSKDDYDLQQTINEYDYQCSIIKEKMFNLYHIQRQKNKLTNEQKNIFKILFPTYNSCVETVDNGKDVLCLLNIIQHFNQNQDLDSFKKMIEEENFGSETFDKIIKMLKLFDIFIK